MARQRKIRIDFRKNRSARRRGGDLTRSMGRDPDHADAQPATERISGKGDLTRRRTIMAVDSAGDGIDALATESAAGTWRGQVMHVHGLESFVRGPDGAVVRCTTRRILRTAATG